MKGDFSRLTFNSSNHYSSVRMQQGRVQVDADWNEQVDIQAHYDRTTTQDIIGRSGAPLHQAGFEITLDPNNSSTNPPNLLLSPGRYYVDGLLCEIDQEVSLLNQPDLPGVESIQKLLSDFRSNLENISSLYLVYLDVWERHLTVLDQPELREVALGGPDTTTRTKIVWQVKLAQVDNNSTCSNFGDGWVPFNTVSTAQLRAQAAPPTGDTTNECLVPPGAGYRRLENQLYRVEIHLGSNQSGDPTFKWSRDNASMVAKLENIVGSAITVSDAGRDAVLGFANARWAELTDEERLLKGEPGFLVELDSVQGNVLNVRTWPNATSLTMADLGTKPTVRRWDGTDLASGMKELESGVQVEFDVERIYLTGDYWLIPARSLTGEVLWPRYR